MKIRFAVIFLFLAFSGTIVVPQAPGPRFEIQFRPAGDAASSEIEWLFSKDGNRQLNRIEQLPQADSNNQGLYIRQPVPNEPFFRIRSIDKNGIPGPWGEIYNTKDYVLQPEPEKIPEPESPLVAVLDSSQKEQWYLRGNVFSLQLPAQLENITYYSLNESPERPYRQDLVFNESGFYKLKLNAYENNNRSNEPVWTKEYSFKVDLKPPLARIFIRPPFKWQYRRLILTPETKVDFLVNDDDAGLENIMTRWYCQNKQPVPEFTLWAPERFLRAMEPCREALFEYYALDKAGNKTGVRSFEFSYLKDEP